MESTPTMRFSLNNTLDTSNIGRSLVYNIVELLELLLAIFSITFSKLKHMFFTTCPMHLACRYL